MLSTLVRREIQGHLLSLRFHVCLATTAILMVMCVVSLSRQQAWQWSEYHEAVGSQERFLTEHAHANRLNPMIRPLLAPARLGAMLAPLGDPGAPNTLYTDSLRELFSPVDLLFVVAILLSLFAIIFSYDSVCGEREQGTLRLLLSYPVGRAQVLLAKLIGGFVALALPFLTSLAIGVLMARLGGRTYWNGLDWVALGLVAVGALLYAQAFFTLGVLISAATKESGNAIFVGLLAWALLVLLIPAAAPLLAERLSPAPSANVVDAQLTELSGQRERDLLAARRSLESKGLSEQDFARQFEVEVNRINAANREAEQQIREPYEARVGRQTAVGWLLASTSPYTSFIVYASSIAGTGLQRGSSFRRQSEQFERAFREFVRPRVDAVRAEFPSDYFDRRLDLKGHPVFVYQEPSFRERLMPFGLLGLVLLLAFSVLFFSGAFVRFLRYDAR